ncbi:ThiF family adenylyltransferase, partial [Candidatus Woesearchaeota archaeon]|nr:ThiF family adenylyltransferase [Candidatus Woesearchaeota archaeon]
MDLSRQIIFEHIGKEKQKLIEEAKIAVIGIGGLGTVVSELLVRSGVGNLLIIDRDFVEESNLQRQSLFLKQDVGELKAYAAKK